MLDTEPENIFIYPGDTDIYKNDNSIEKQKNNTEASIADNSIYGSNTDDLRAGSCSIRI